MHCQVEVDARGAAWFLEQLSKHDNFKGKYVRATVAAVSALLTPFKVAVSAAGLNDRLLYESVTSHCPGLVGGRYHLQSQKSKSYFFQLGKGGKLKSEEQIIGPAPKGEWVTLSDIPAPPHLAARPAASHTRRARALQVCGSDPESLGSGSGSGTGRGAAPTGAVES